MIIHSSSSVGRWSPSSCSIHRNLAQSPTSLLMLIFIFASSIGQQLQLVDAGKSLVFFAGPHHSGGIKSIQQFFYNYADKHHKNNKPTFALKEWRWPRFDDLISSMPELSNNNKYEEEPYKIMEQFVTQADNDEIQDALISQLKSVYEESELGLILGTPEFDKSSGGYKQGLDAMKRIVHALNPDPSNVTVVLNYRTPRIDQWVSVWWEHHQQKLFEQSKILSYEEYMCNDLYTQHNLEVMETSMNPMGIALNYIKEGWNVALLDEAGVEQAGRDLPTVMGCDVVNASCHNGVVRNHWKHPFHENETLQVDEALPTPEERELANRLLASRDCSYESQLRDKIMVLHNVSVWKDCDTLEDGIQVTDNGILFGALQSQVVCDGESYKHSNIYSNVTIEKVLNIHDVTTEESKDTLLVGNNNNDGGFMEAVLFPVVLICVGGYQLYLMMVSKQQRKQQQNNNNRTGEAIREAELSEMMEDDDTDGNVVNDGDTNGGNTKAHLV